MNLFVYGTLMKRGPANRLVGREAKFVSHAKIPGKMYNLGAYPGITLNKPDDNVGLISGEIWEIEDDTIYQLDRYEGYSPAHPGHSLYLRKTITIDGSPCEVYVYNGSTVNHREIASGCWENENG